MSLQPVDEELIKRIAAFAGLVVPDGDLALLAGAAQNQLSAAAVLRALELDDVEPIVSSTLAGDDRTLWLSIADASRGLRSGDTTSIELTQAILDRIDATDSSVHAYTGVMRDSAIEDAERADAELAARSPRSALHGIPVAVKDLCFTAGFPTEAGSRVLKGFAAVQRCRRRQASPGGRGDRRQDGDARICLRAGRSSDAKRRDHAGIRGARAPGPLSRSPSVRRLVPWAPIRVGRSGFRPR